jgi:predicted metal-binding protein
MKKLKYTNLKNFPPSLSEIVEMNPKDIPVDAYARILCQACGLWGRAILCPPLLYQTYPQYETIKKTKEYLRTFDKAYVYVFKNDGSLRWWSKKQNDKFKHIELKKRVGRQLKGCEASSARVLTKMMYKIKRINARQVSLVETFVQGHCDLCSHKCPNRNNPPCIKGGLPSLESIGINVYKLLNKLNIEYEYPVINYLTQVTMMLVRE